MKSFLPLALLMSLLVIYLASRRVDAQEKIASNTQSDKEDEDDDGTSPSQRSRSSPPTNLRFYAPTVPDGAYYVQYFPGPNNLASHNLVASQSKKESQLDANLAKYDGNWSVEVPTSSALEGDFSLIMKSRAKHYAVAARLAKPFLFDRADKHFVIQYEVKFQNGIDCGGAYVKLLTEGPGLDLKNFNDKTPYTIMFGPDKCGTDLKLHFILRHRNPKTGQVEEKHAKKPKGDLSTHFTDKRTHLYTLVVKSDNRFEVYVDRTLVNSGSLLVDMEPPINPPKDVDEPSDKKPDDWDDRDKISDPKAIKPADWDETQPEFVENISAVMPQGWLVDEPLTVPDPKAEKPKDWDDDVDGAWEPALIENPKCIEAPGCGPWTRPRLKNQLYKGKWSPPMIDNPAFTGAWKPQRISNPDLLVDNEPWRFEPIGAIGFELWSMNDEVAFDNILIVDRKSLADAFADQTWSPKREAERLSDSTAQSVVDAVRELTRERPWIWAALLVGVVLPLVLLIAYCCCLRDTGTASTNVTAMRQKTNWDDDYDETKQLEGQAEGDGDGVEQTVEEEAVAVADHQVADVRDVAYLGSDYEEEDDDSDEPPDLVELDTLAGGAASFLSLIESNSDINNSSTVRKRASRKE